MKKPHFTQAIAFALVCMFAASCASAQSQSAPRAPLAVTTETQASLPGYNIYRPTDMAATGAPLPIIAWANGGCVRRDQTWTTILERWASEGFFVVSVTSLPGADPAAPGRFTVDEQAAAIDWAIAQNAAAGSPYAGRLDVNRIVAAGNSCGGMTSLTLAARDPRVKSVYILSGSSVGPNPQPGQAEAVMNNVSAPVVWVVGGTEDIARTPANIDYGLLRDGVGAMVVQRNAGDHRTVSTDPAIQAVAADVGVTWFRATLFNDAAATRTLQTSICGQCDAATWSAQSKNLGRR